MKTIKLYGEMGKRFGREFQLDVQTPAEAVRALSSQVKGFRAYLHAHQQDAFTVFVGGRNSSEELGFPCSDKEIIRIAPVIQGARAVGRIVLGVVLIIASFFTGGTALAAFGPMMFGMGASMAIGGIVQLLSPTPSSDSGMASESVTNKPSYNFNGPVNTTAQGHPVPLAYGKVICGSAVISAGLIQ